MSKSSKSFDIVLFGVTGFTGKLAVEYLLQKGYPNWAACARNETKAKDVLKKIADASDSANKKEEEIPLLVADLVCKTDEQKEKLRDVVKSTKVVLTTAGPFEKYGLTLAQLCAEEGVHYADITGETAFVRHTIEHYDSIARKSGALIVSHCGNDCIPSDLTAFEMNKFATQQGGTLIRAATYNQFPASATFSGGTAITAVHQLAKSTQKSDAPFDPLLTNADGQKSAFKTTITHKSTVYNKEFDCKAGPWIMAPVMANCVRRSNALLGYNHNLEFGDAFLSTDKTWTGWAKRTTLAASIGAAIYVAPMRAFLPQPGEGPPRQDMEHGYLFVHGRGTMTTTAGGEEEEKQIESKFHFKKDVAYLMTAEMLVEAGMLLVEKAKRGKTDGGVVSPAAAFGSSLTERLLKEMDVSFEIKLVE